MKLIKDHTLCEIIEENKPLIFPLLFYIAGLVTGSVLFRDSAQSLSSFYKSVFTVTDLSFYELFLSRCGLYLFIYTVSVLLSFLLFGYRVLNIIPLLCGIAAGIKLSYYYSMSLNGFGYAAILVIPETSILITLLLFTIRNCISFSREIYNKVKDSDITYDLNTRSYLKIFIIYALILLLIALLNSAISYLIAPLIRF